MCASEDDNESHAFDRYVTEQISCMACQTVQVRTAAVFDFGLPVETVVLTVVRYVVQPVGKICINDKCKTEFACYFCDVCKFFDDDASKDIYHCDKCKICRIGKVGR